MLRGRCRDCSASIPWRYPIVELGTALLITLAFARFGATAYAVLAAGFLVVLVAISAIDIEHHIIPNSIVLPAAAVTLVAHTLIDPSPEWAIAAIGAVAVLLTIALIKPGGMGMGDVKLCLLLGAMLGRNVGVALLVGLHRGDDPLALSLRPTRQGSREDGYPARPVSRSRQAPWRSSSAPRSSMPGLASVGSESLDHPRTEAFMPHTGYRNRTRSRPICVGAV